MKKIISYILIIISIFFISGCSNITSEAKPITGKVNYLKSEKDENYNITYHFNIYADENDSYGYQYLGMFESVPNSFTSRKDFFDKSINTSGGYSYFTIRHRSEIVYKYDETQIDVLIENNNTYENLYFVVWQTDNSIYSYKVK